MSDIPLLGKFLPDYVTEDSRSLNMFKNKKKKNKESFCCVDIPMALLLCWEEIRKHYPGFQPFVSLLNKSIPGCGFAVNEEAARIKERL